MSRRVRIIPPHPRAGQVGTVDYVSGHNIAWIALDAQPDLIAFRAGEYEAISEDE